MKKLTLQVEKLTVETFDPAVVEAGRPGTVEGNQQDTYVPCCTASCGGTCGAQPASDWLRIARTLTNCPQCCV